MTSGVTCGVLVSHSTSCCLADPPLLGSVVYSAAGMMGKPAQVVKNYCS